MATYSSIAANIQSMDDIHELKKSSKRIRFVNLHGNKIRYISNLNTCYYLQELDLSSNSLSQISGLEACESLLKLNLSCNKLKLISGLEFLYKLQTLNLSYNELRNVKNLSHFSEERFRLENLYLHSNNLSSIPGTLAGIKKILTLRNLTIHSNPLCSNGEYRKILGDCMPQIVTIDDFERSDDSFLTTDSVGESSVNTQVIDTPFIDNAMQRFCQPNNDSINSTESDVSIVAAKIGVASALPTKKEEIAESKDYTDLIKQVLNVLHAEDKPTKLERGHDVSVIENLEEEEAAVNLPPRNIIFKDAFAQADINSLKSTNKMLLIELETERERRWKSEQHITELTDKLSKNERFIKEYEALNKSSEAGINGIRDMLIKEQQQKHKLADLLDAFKIKHKEVVDVLNTKEDAIEKRNQDIIRLQTVIDNMKERINQSLKSHRTTVQQAKQETQVQRKECEILRHKVQDLQSQVTSLKELIVTREQEHTKEKSNLVPLNGEEFNKCVNKVVDNEREKHDLKNKNLIESVRTQKEKYSELEKEFRMALYFENQRYNELHKSYTKLSANLSTARDHLTKFKKDTSVKNEVITKLKNGIEEQNTFIDKIRRTKEELDTSNRTKIQCLENELEDSTSKVCILSNE